MKKTYLKPKTLVVKVETQHVICLSTNDDPASQNGVVYGRRARFSNWEDEEEEY
jgi:hypothetical protein